MAVEPLTPLTPERRRQQTREHLLRAAADVFAAKGFHGASLDAVAAAAGFTKGAVYSNFKNKEDLFLALLEDQYEREMRALHATLESSDVPPQSRLSDFVALLVEEFEGSTVDWSALYEEFCLYAMRNPSARKKLAEFRRADVANVAAILRTERERQGEALGSSESPEDAARIIVALMRGIGQMRVIDPESVEESFLQTVIAFLARALDPPRQPESG